MMPYFSHNLKLPLRSQLLLSNARFSLTTDFQSGGLFTRDE